MTAIDSPFERECVRSVFNTVLCLISTLWWKCVRSDFNFEIFLGIVINCEILPTVWLFSQHK